MSSLLVYMEIQITVLGTKFLASLNSNIISYPSVYLKRQPAKIVFSKCIFHRLMILSVRILSFSSMAVTVSCKKKKASGLCLNAALISELSPIMQMQMTGKTDVAPCNGAFFPDRFFFFLGVYIISKL